MELRLRLQLWCLLSGMLVTMDPGEIALSQQIRCDGCRQSAPSYDMLMSFEGWQFKLNLADKSEEL